MSPDPRRTPDGAARSGTERRLAESLKAVAAHGGPHPDAWATIDDRVRREAAGEVSLATVPTDSSGARTRQSVRWLAAAAVVLLVAGTITAVTIARHENASTTVTAAEPSPGDGATGWYIPVGLPYGWKLDLVSGDRQTDRCPCRSGVWTNSSGSEGVIVDSVPDPGGPDPLDAANIVLKPVDLGGNVVGQLSTRDASWDLTWSIGGQRYVVSARGINQDKAHTIGASIVAGPATHELPIPGLRLRGNWSEEGRTSPHAQVDVTMTSPEGHRVGYEMRDNANGVSSLFWHGPEEMMLPRQGLPLLVGHGSSPHGSDFAYLGRWPGATVSYVNAGQMTFDSSDDPTREEIEILIGALRPATAAQWLSFIQGASNRDGGLSADSLADYAGGRAGTVPPPKQLGDPGDLDLTVTAETKLATGEDAIVVLHVANPTGHPINDPSCALDRAEAALVPKGESDPPQPEGATIEDPWWHVKAPCREGIRLDPGATEDIRLVVRASYRDERYGPLPGGDYRVVVRIGDRRIESPPVGVGAVPCGASGAGFEPSYVGLSLAAAKQRAKAGGASVRDVTTAPDGIGNESTACDRINVIIHYGKVAFARRY